MLRRRIQVCPADLRSYRPIVRVVERQVHYAAIGLAVGDQVHRIGYEAGAKTRAAAAGTIPNDAVRFAVAVVIAPKRASEVFGVIRGKGTERGGPAIGVGDRKIEIDLV